MKLDRIAIIFFMLLLPLVHSQAVVPVEGLSDKFSGFESTSYNNIFLDALKDWRALAILGIFIGVVFSALMYMFGEAFDIGMLKYYFKIEMKDLFANALLIVFFIFVLSLIDFASTTIGFAGSSSPCLNTDGFCFGDQIKTYLQNSYVNPIKSQIKAISKVLASNQHTSSYNFGIDSIYGLYSSSGFGTTSQYLNYHLYPVKSVMESTYLLLKVFLFALDLSGNVLGPALIALGIFARCFFFTRKMGSTVLAIGIGMLAVFPFLAYFFYIPFFSPLTEMNIQDELDCPLVCTNPVVSFTSPTNNPPNLNPPSGEPITRDSFIEHIETHMAGLSGTTIIDGKAIPNTEIFLQSVEKFSEGALDKITMKQASGAQRTFYSCEYIAKNMFNFDCYNPNDPSDVASAKCTDWKLEDTKSKIPPNTQSCENYDAYKYYNGCNGFENGIYCFADCRKLPYPDDSILCRDAETSCKAMFEYYPECFSVMYAYSNDALYSQILNHYGYDNIIDINTGESDFTTYERVCPKECRNVPNLIPGKKFSLDDYCPTFCRDSYVGLVTDAVGANTFSDAVARDGNAILSSECADKNNYDCITDTANPNNDKGYYKQSSIKVANNNNLLYTFIPNPNKPVNWAYQPQEGKGAKLATLSKTSYNGVSDTVPLPFEVKVIPKNNLAISKCSGCSVYQAPLRYYPVYADCSSCAKSTQAPNFMANQKFSYDSLRELGKIVLSAFVIPMLIVIATVYATAGLSDYLSGDLFIPSIGKIIPQ